MRNKLFIFTISVLGFLFIPSNANAQAGEYCRKYNKIWERIILNERGVGEYYKYKRIKGRRYGYHQYISWKLQDDSTIVFTTFLEVPTMVKYREYGDGSSEPITVSILDRYRTHGENCILKIFNEEGDSAMIYMERIDTVIQMPYHSRPVNNEKGDTLIPRNTKIIQTGWYDRFFNETIFLPPYYLKTPTCSKLQIWILRKTFAFDNDDWKYDKDGESFYLQNIHPATCEPPYKLRRKKHIKKKRKIHTLPQFLEYDKRYFPWLINYDGLKKKEPRPIWEYIESL